ncbi:MAG: L-seryl-tRNA(Sec) selenium transferase [Bacillota bacterium]
MATFDSQLRKLPSVSSVLEWPEIQQLMAAMPRELVVDGCRRALQGLREAIIAGENPWLTPEALRETVVNGARRLGRPRLRPVINGTGVILHTNLGRAPLAQEAVQRLQAMASGFSNLEYDLDSGGRGSRHDHASDLICRLTGAEAAMVVNNNAGAVLLALSALAAGREVIVSRGELVEIGGSFRIPEVMAQSGARLVEVGCTNKTRLDDYRRAITAETAALLKVHTSNYRIVGFTEEASLADLVTLGREHGLPVIDDLGSGVLVDVTRFGLPAEPTVAERVRAGADLVAFSGDKLLGGPQAGLLVGRRDLIARVQRHPLARALRIDKLTLTALEATLALYLDEEGWRRIPTLHWLSRSAAEVRRCAGELMAAVLERAEGRLRLELIDGTAEVGGGSLPTASLPTTCLAVAVDGWDCQELASRLRQTDPPVIGRIESGRFLIDLRAMGANDIRACADSLEQLSREVGR